MIELNTVDTRVFMKLHSGRFSETVRAGKYSFDTGINVLAGSRETGSFGINCLMSGRCRFYGSKVLLDGKEITKRELYNISCLIGVPPEHCSRTTVRRLIERGINKNGDSGLTYQQISEKFLLTPERTDRRVAYQGNERFRASIAIGYASGKHIYCTAFIDSEQWDKYYSIVLRPYLLTLRDEGMTVLLATDDAKCVKDIADKIYYLDKEE